ncbi:CoA-binding protein [Marinobacter sp. SS21]|uniref:CoA-binding protein n=1 Tax=Marinobacter sp. SS21 TaxID=2979460 RepID=UPI00232DAF55|nr:CoA-binding protein [Marinobacter sp. SS21]MDC0662836.1 CoA-binding protein [Marinobacter sp. SS21]
MPLHDPDAIRQLLESTTNIALVGASDKPQRPSHEVMVFLQQQGYRVIPVNPRLEGQTLLGERVYATITDIPDPIDLVDVFLAPERTDPVIDRAIDRGVPAVWLQIGVINHPGADRAEQAGLAVVMDRCPKRDIPSLGILGPGRRPASAH